jgi:hypothetical protein
VIGAEVPYTRTLKQTWFVQEVIKPRYGGSCPRSGAGNDLHRSGTAHSCGRSRCRTPTLGCRPMKFSASLRRMTKPHSKRRARTRPRGGQKPLRNSKQNRRVPRRRVRARLLIPTVPRAEESKKAAGNGITF